MKNKVIRILKAIWGIVPTRTPIGATAFDIWASSIFDTYGFPNTPGYRQALATMLMHEKRYWVSKLRLAVAIRKGEVNETAYHIMKDIQQQKKAAEDLLNATQKENVNSATVTTEMVS